MMEEDENEEGAGGVAKPSLQAYKSESQDDVEGRAERRKWAKEQ